MATVISLLTFVSCNGQNHERADSLFYSANERLKTNMFEIDSFEIQKSIVDYSEAIRLNPKFWQAYRNRSRLYQQTKQFDKAIMDLTTALKYADKNSSVNLHDMRAYSYYELGNYQDAILDWNIAVDNLGNPSHALLHRAKAKWQFGQRNEACLDYEKAIELNKDLVMEKEFIECE
ncbi:MAG TPA: tetratricopeptide repeat protein [Chitinophagales bacterium]|nr:tetratricopeptide repeat protein [Chitinophagales bacterium]